jgi:hypothetical protein
MSSTAAPASRNSTRRARNDWLAPMSTPRVGWLATRKRGRASSSRASTAFCMFPPDSVPGEEASTP